MINTIRRRRAVQIQSAHSAGTCPSCQGSGRAPAPRLAVLTLLPCGPCGATGSSR